MKSAERMINPLQCYLNLWREAKQRGMAGLVGGKCSSLQDACPLFGPCWGPLSSYCIISKSNILLYHHCNLSLWIVCMCVYTSVCFWCGYDRTFDIFKASCPVALLRCVYSVCVCVCFVFPADLLCIKWGFCSLMATSKNRHMKANMNMHACVYICMFSVAVLHSKRWI